MTNPEINPYLLGLWLMAIWFGVITLCLLTWRIERTLRTIQNVLAAVVMLALPRISPEPPKSEPPKTELPS